MIETQDTIVAVATPPGAGGIGVVRVSGPLTQQISEAVLGDLPAPRQATAVRFLGADGDAIDIGIALFFPSPASYTGENVLELQGHGGMVVLDQLLARVTALGARLARPGEFTERAFLNGKLDLAQAEAVADLIGSQTQAAARSALRSLTGDFSEQIGALSEQIGEFRVYIEANIDFSDEPIEPLPQDQATERLILAREALKSLLERARPGALLGRGASVVVAGAPNAGKSSLLNALARTERAIVSEIPGTTRDLIEITIELDGLAVHLTDTAGLRASTDTIESEGVRRANAAMDGADLVLYVIDDASATAGQGATNGWLNKEAAQITLYNKCDLSGRPAGPVSGQISSRDEPAAVALSAKTGEGLEVLEKAITTALGYTSSGEGAIMARRRHLDALERAHKHLTAAEAHLGDAPELLAEELRLAQQALGEITGAVTTEDLLGRIFASFCIGK
ncbi:MAG: tRNA uridine-5-carboxymethylaminomethyl(34) synthesis GTPase MnmE [Arenicellales bacterium]|nr:tRNA uridine-5-carboxymethylaminomethyl(34) synthesis GTPase MnmE [Arenicellales bacterium]MDP6948688.1 tRNA uridine-5-carboxymethylaminomethyl(34) synthesis GTPase MnmE [Arenicellales bacterium]